MNNEMKNRILDLLINRAPNWVSEIILDAHGIHCDENFKRVIKKLESTGQIEVKEDPRGEKASPITYYRVKSTEDLLIRNFIKIGDVKVPRVLSIQKPSLFPEDYNEAIEQLAVYTDSLEKSFENRIKDQQKNYWAQTISIFAILVGLLTIILGNAPTLSSKQSTYQGFWNTLGKNFAVLIPFCSILIIFALLMWFIIMHTPYAKHEDK